MRSQTDERVGSQRPRVSSRPDYVSSAGLEAIELAESAGLFLDPWQQFVLTESLGERRDGKWSAFEVGLIVPRQNGKGSVLEARELFGLFLGGERLIVHTSELFVTSLDAFRRIRSLIENTPDLDRQVKKMGARTVGYRTTTGQEGIELVSGARLKFMARSPDSGRGLTGDLVILDEAYGLTDNQVDSLLPTLSARPNPQLWYTSSPILKADTGAPLTSMRKRGMAGGSSLAYFEWSVPEGSDLDDRDNWAQANPAMGYRVSEEFVAKERDTLTDAGFARERLCIWPPEGNAKWQVISRDQWASAVADEVVDHDPVVVALEVSTDRRYSTVGVAGGRPDGDVGVGLVAHEAGTDWVPSRLVAVVRDLKPARLIVNDGSAAASLVPDIAAALLAAELDVEIVSMNAREVAAAYGMVHDALVRPEGAEPWRLWHSVNGLAAVLTDAVAGAGTRKVGNEGTTWDGDGVAPLKAVTHAVWGYVTRPADQPFFGAWR